MFLPPPMQLPPSILSNHLRAVLGVLLSLKKKPVIRWEKMSQAGRKLAVEVQVSMARNQPDNRPLCNIPLIGSCSTSGLPLVLHLCY